MGSRGSGRGEQITRRGLDHSKEWQTKTLPSSNKWERKRFIKEKKDTNIRRMAWRVKTKPNLLVTSGLVMKTRDENK